MKRFDIYGRVWHGANTNTNTPWVEETADTDMGNLTWDELNTFLGPLFLSKQDWLAWMQEASACARRWFKQDVRSRPNLRWSIL